MSMEEFEAFLEALGWYCEDKTFTAFAVVCVARLQRIETHHKYEAEKRIEKVRKSLSKLSRQDRDHLDMAFQKQQSQRILGKSDHLLIAPDMPSLCDAMEQALQAEVPNQKKSEARKILTEFALEAVREDWIDTSENSNDLTAVLTAIMKEADVKCNARTIAVDAIKYA